jgi:hypothetical protein
VTTNRRSTPASLVTSSSAAKVSSAPMNGRRSSSIASHTAFLAPSICSRSLISACWRFLRDRGVRSRWKASRSGQRHRGRVSRRSIR